MDTETQADFEEVVPAAADQEVEESTTAPSQEKDPVQEELERVEAGKRTKKEKLLYTRERINKQLAELGEEVEEDDDRPLTLKDFRALQASEAQETAKTLANEIVDENERKLVLHYLETTIRPSGDAQTDLRNAQLMVASVKNRMIAEESTRAAAARTRPSAPAAPPKQEGQKPELTDEQRRWQQATGMTDEEVLASLKG